MRNLASESIEVGHFKKQGTHSSGMTYPELMALHHAPELNGKDFPARPIRDILKFRNQGLKAGRINKAVREYSKRKSNEASLKRFLADIGTHLRDEEKKIFGSKALAPNAVPPKDRNNPMIETGDLRSKVAYRTSKDKSIKEG